MEYQQILTIQASPLKNKRFRALLNSSTGRKPIHIDFGAPKGYTYIDGASEKVKENYLKRHLANKTEKDLIWKLTLSPALLSAKLTWGETRDINENLKLLNKEFIGKKVFVK